MEVADFQAEVAAESALDSKILQNVRIFGQKWQQNRLRIAGKYTSGENRQKMTDLSLETIGNLGIQAKMTECDGISVDNPDFLM